MDPSHTLSADPVPAVERPQASPQAWIDAPDLRVFVLVLFFISGGITSLNDVIIPKLKGLFLLSYGQVMLVASAFFAAYFIVSIPAAAMVRRIGYMRTAVLGLAVMSVGCLLFLAASWAGIFAAFLGALFVLASGVATLQVVGNPLISMLGPPRTAHSRLTFAQAFNALGSTTFPYLGAILILGPVSHVDPKTLTDEALSAYRAVQMHSTMLTYLGLAMALAAVAAVAWSRRNRLHEHQEAPGKVLDAFTLLHDRRFRFGALCIFLYVGAEITMGSLMVSYLMQPSVLALGQLEAGKHLPFYWGGSLLGRFAGSYLLRFIAPGKALASVAAGAIGLILVSANTAGDVSGWTLLAVGLMNSIMFPTIFSLASENLGVRAAEGSGVICVAIVGGALIPPLTGLLADHSGLAFALVVPALCYAVILSFGLYTRRPKV